MNTDTISNMYQELGVDKDVCDFGTAIEAALKDRFDQIDTVTEYNQLKVISAMQKCRVSAECFQGSTGYGYNDLGRETLEAVYAAVFHTEAALVRPQITCGTHALALALAGNLRPGDEMISISGKPYDTLEEVIGIRPSNGSLAEYGITYSQVDLTPEGEFDLEGIKKAISDKTKLVEIQRSKGYQTRPSLSVKKIAEAIQYVKSIRSDIIVMVDNCYGEFVETKEPTQVGADLIVGSLIKNPGGGIAQTGGYIAGRKGLVEQCSYRLTCVGMGKEVGCTLNQSRSMYMGLFWAPGVVANAVKTSVFATCLFEQLGFSVYPRYDEPRTDIIAALRLGNAERLIAFCQGIQSGSPVDAFVSPEPWDMPGYDSKVIMAAGAFTGGASIELSADAPLKEPYAVWLQGGLTYQTGKTGVLLAAQSMAEKGLLNL